MSIGGQSNTIEHVQGDSWPDMTAPEETKVGERAHFQHSYSFWMLPSGPFGLGVQSSGVESRFKETASSSLQCWSRSHWHFYSSLQACDWLPGSKKDEHECVHHCADTEKVKIVSFFKWVLFLASFLAVENWWSRNRSNIITYTGVLQIMYPHRNQSMLIITQSFEWIYRQFHL